MGKLYPYSTKWKKNIVVILHIYGAIAIFILFCDRQDTESESCEIEMSISQPMFTYKNIKGSMGQ